MTSKWKAEFCSMYKDTENLERLTKEIRTDNEEKEMQRQVDQAISNMLRDKKLKNWLGKKGF